MIIEVKDADPRKPLKSRKNDKLIICPKCNHEFLESQSLYDPEYEKDMERK
jgi:hypothetical protein